MRGNGREAAIRRQRTCQKFSSPHGEGPHRLFGLGRDVGATQGKVPRAFGGVRLISQKGENRQFSTAFGSPSAAGKAIRAEECQGQTQNRKSRALPPFRSVELGLLLTSSLAPDRSFPPVAPCG